MDNPGLALAGLNLLLVRPQRDHDAFVQRIIELGCQVYALPVMAIKPLVLDEFSRKTIAQIDKFDKVIVVSSNAARLIVEHIPAPRQLPSLSGWFAVGESSASPLLAAGIPVTFPADNATSEGLLTLPAFAQVKSDNILIIRGVGGRHKLRAELEERGARVTFCEIYRREMDATHQVSINSLLEAGAVQVVVAHSVDVLRNFLRLLNNNSLKALGEMAVLVPSQSAADLARQAGCGVVIQSQSALPASMVDALVGWYTAT